MASCTGIPLDAETRLRAARGEWATAFGETAAGERVPLGKAPSFEDCLRHAMLRRPAVRAAYLEWAASVEAVTVERSLPDPKLTFEADIASLVMAAMPGLMIDLPGPGKLRTRGEAAGAESEMAYHRLESAVLRTAYDVKKAAYEWRLAEDRLRVSRETVGLLGDLEKLAQSRTEVGKGNLQDLLRIRMERERMQTEAANLADSRGWHRERFKAALGLEPDDPPPPLPKLPASKPVGTADGDLLARAFAANPGLREMEADIRKAEAALALAEKSRLPDAEAGIEADVKAAPVMLRPALTMSLPVWRDKIRGEISGARYRSGAARARLAEQKLDLAVEVAMKSFEYRESNRTLELLEDSLLPKAQQSLEVARSGYSTGGTSFLDLIDAQRTLLDFQLARLEARTGRELALADLSLRLVGIWPEEAPGRHQHQPE